MFILCIALNEEKRNQGIEFVEKQGWKVLLVGGVPGMGGSPAFLVEARVSEDDRGKTVIMLSELGLEVESLNEEQ